MKITITIAALLFAVNANSQVKLNSNDPGIRYDLIQPAHTFSKVTTFDSLGNKVMEFVNEEVVKIDKNTNQIIFTRFRQVPLGRISLDTTIIGPQPLTMHFSDIPLRYELNVKFNAVSVSVQSFIKGKRNMETFKMNEGYFDDNILENICGYLPFKKGVQYTLDCFRYESKNNGLNKFQLAYEFDDYLPGENGKVTECRVLKFKNDYANGYLWVDKKTNEMIKEVAKSGAVNIYLIRI